MDNKNFIKDMNNRLEQLRDSMTRLTGTHQETAAKVGGVGSVGWIGNKTDFTNNKPKGASTNINLGRKCSKFTRLDRHCRRSSQNSKQGKCDGWKCCNFTRKRNNESRREFD